MSKKNDVVKQGIDEFAVDYSYWWNKKDLSAEELSAVIFGINPRAFEHFNIVDSKPRNAEEQKFSHDFQEFVKSLKYGDIFTIRELRAELLTRKNYWKGKKAKFNYVKNLYEEGLRYLGNEIHPDFIDFLRTEPELSKFFESFDKYKNHEIYEADLSADIAQIHTSQEAAAILLGLNLQYLLEFQRVKQEIQKEPEGEGYFKLSGEDKILFREYKIFMNKYYGHAFFVPDITITNKTFPELAKIEFQSLSQFANAAYNDGYLFRKSVTDFLEQNGIKLKYNTDSWVIKNYKHFAKEPLWTVEQAFNLFKGIFRFEGSHAKGNNSMIDLREDNSLFTYHGSEYAWAWDSNIEELVNIMPRLEKACRAGTLEFVEYADDVSFKPKVIIEWLRKNTECTPNQALLQVMELEQLSDKEEAISSKRAKNNRWKEIEKLIQAQINQVKELKPSDEDYADFFHKNNVGKARKGSIIKSAVCNKVFDNLKTDLKGEMKQYNTFETSVSKFCKVLKW